MSHPHRNPVWAGQLSQQLQWCGRVPACGGKNGENISTLNCLGPGSDTHPIGENNRRLHLNVRGLGNIIELHPRYIIQV